MTKEFKPIPIYRDCLLRNIEENGGGGGGGDGPDLSDYLKKEDAKNTYQVKGDYATTINGRVPYEQLPTDIKPDLTKYYTIDESYSRYLTQYDASMKYQPLGDYATTINGIVTYTQLPEDIKPNLSDYSKKKMPILNIKLKGIMQLL